jgi:hypothetical protein
MLRVTKTPEADMELKLGDTVMRESGKPPRITLDPHEVVVVRCNKVVLRSKKYPGGKAVTVKIANIGVGRDAGTTFYVET